MKNFFSSLLKNIGRCFSVQNLPWHFLAIILTYIIVVSGFDWSYFLATRSPVLMRIMFPAVILGALLPIIVPLLLLLIGRLKKNDKLIETGWAIGQAALIGAFISGFYKAFTGRIHPSLIDTALDISRQFQIGFLRGGVFWGWPSSHTTVAFAMAFTIIVFYPKQRILSAIVFFYALYIGFGISLTIHWFSEFIAGAIFGIIIGLVVGKSYRNMK
jgi:membrane-associated phospholipid phosphatase